MSSPSAKLVEEVVARLGDRASAAAALQISRQLVARVLASQGALGVVATVRAAVLIGRDPLRALRDVGEEDAANVLAQAFGQAVTRRQRAILNQIDGLPPIVRRYLLGLIAEWSGKPNTP